MKFNELAESLLTEALKIDGEEIKLQPLYDKFNKELFQNKLPRVPLKWGKSKKWGGKVTFRSTNPRQKWKTDEYEINRDSVVLHMSDFFNRDITSFENVLIHEMIHVWHIFESGDRDYDIIKSDSHGPLFDQKRLEIKEKTGRDIPKTEDVSDLTVSDSVKIPYKIAVILNEDQYPSIMVFNKKVYDQDKFQFIKRFKNVLRNYEDEAIIISSNHPELVKYPEKRKIGPKFPFLIINKDKINEILKHGDTTIIAKIGENKK